ncbi:MAG: glycosyltransferase [Candidatus Bathyarchaeia archaeon]|jgi:trehalose synthase
MLRIEQLRKIEIDDYVPIVGQEEVDSVKALAEPLKGKSVTHVNSTAFGGGVAELLENLVPIMKDVGLDVHWEVIKGSVDFFNVTKKIHNALQGMSLDLSAEDVRTYLEYNRMNSESTILNTDFVVIHDNQPAAMIQFLPAKNDKWIWRCHIDLSTPNLAVWNFLEPYISQYDAAIFTSEKYVMPSLKVPKIFVRPPSIDPLSDKNKEITADEISEVLKKYGINPEKPIITQVGRFDPWKDPVGMIDVYRLVKKEIPQVQLLLIAGMAADDPEGWTYFEKTARHAGDDSDIHLLTDFKGVKDLEVNAFQRASQVILQMSTREGFGLSVTEALWKGIPVIGRNVGGIPLQIINESNGFLVNTVSEAAEKVQHLLNHKEEAKQMGMNGKEHVKSNFLIINDLKDYLRIFAEI